MLNPSQEIMLYQIQTILDEIVKDTAKLTGKVKKADGTLTLIVEFGTSLDRSVEAEVRVELISYSLANQLEKMFLFDSVELAYRQVNDWYEERKVELAELTKLDRNSFAAQINKPSSQNPIILEEQ